MERKKGKIIVEKASVRSFPSGTIIGEVLIDQVFDIIMIRGDWIEIPFGWIFINHIEIIKEQE